MHTQITMSANTPLLQEDQAAAPACAYRPKSARTAALPDRQSLLASITTLFLTLPALLGSCCWPVLLVSY